jgi:hypothetical protein
MIEYSGSASSAVVPYYMKSKVIPIGSWNMTVPPYSKRLWISPDPARQYHSPYDYTGGNPVNMVDPDGRAAGDAFTAIQHPMKALNAGVLMIQTGQAVRDYVRATRGPGADIDVISRQTGNDVDAYRHAHWAISLVRHLGPVMALEVLRNHEYEQVQIGPWTIGTPGTPGEFLQDAFNNLAAIDAASNPSNRAILTQDLALQLMQGGRLLTTQGDASNPEHRAAADRFLGD